MKDESASCIDSSFILHPSSFLRQWHRPSSEAWPITAAAPQRIRTVFPIIRRVPGESRRTCRDRGLDVVRDARIVNHLRAACGFARGESLALESRRRMEDRGRMRIESRKRLATPFWFLLATSAGRGYNKTIRRSLVDPRPEIAPCPRRLLIPSFDCRSSSAVIRSCARSTKAAWAPSTSLTIPA